MSSVFRRRTGGANQSGGPNEGGVGGASGSTAGSGGPSWQDGEARRWGLPALCAILFLALMNCMFSDSTPRTTSGDDAHQREGKAETLAREEAGRALANMNLKLVLAKCPNDGEVDGFKGVGGHAPEELTKGGSIRLASLKHDRRLKMAVYAKSKNNPSVDVVSDMLVHTGEFEARLVNVIYSAFELMSKNTSRFNQSDFLFIDIGSNVGIYSMVMSNLGVSTFAVDALRNNVALLDYSSRCLNPYLIKLNKEENVTFKVVQSALASPAQLAEGKARSGGKKQAECALVSEFDNLGDGMMVCDDAKIKDLLSRKYTVRDRMKLQMLDEVFSQNKVFLKKGTIVKMDIEGQEWHAIQGAMNSLFSPSPPQPKVEGGITPAHPVDPKELRPKLVLAEIWRKFFNVHEAEKYADYMMNKLGYVCAIESTTVAANLDPVWCSYKAVNERGERVPCVMTTPKQFSSWLFTFVKVNDMRNLLWVQPEWGPVMTPWAYPSKIHQQHVKASGKMNGGGGEGAKAYERENQREENAVHREEQLEKQKSLIEQANQGGGVGVFGHGNEGKNIGGGVFLSRDPRNAVKNAMVHDNMKKVVAEKEES